MQACRRAGVLSLRRSGWSPSPVQPAPIDKPPPRRSANFQALGQQQWATGSGKQAAGPKPKVLPNLCWARILNVRHTHLTYCQNRETSGCICIQNVPDAVLHFPCRALGIDLWQRGERRFCSGSRLDHEEALQQPLTACMNPSATAATECPCQRHGRGNCKARVQANPQKRESFALPAKLKAQETTQHPHQTAHSKEGVRDWAVALCKDTGHLRDSTAETALFSAHPTRCVEGVGCALPNFLWH